MVQKEIEQQSVFEEAEDVLTTYNFIKKNAPNTDLILFGSSMGAVAIMKAVAEKDIQPTKNYF